MAEKKATVLLRLEPALRDQLFAQAKRNDRTVTAEATRIFRDGLQRIEQAHLEAQNA
jgi:hypothetical protein